MKHSRLQTKVSWLKRMLSYLTPIKLQEWQGSKDNHLEVYLHNNQFQLIQDNAIYSYGLQYKPFLEGFKAIAYERLVASQSVLVLGSGLGSIPHILQEQYSNKERSFTIIDIDRIILNLCSDYLAAQGIANCTFIREDAQLWVAMNKQQPQYDLICVDIFEDIVVPPVFLELNFLQQLATQMQQHAYLVFNYIIDEEQEYDTFYAHLQKVFEQVSVVNFRRNRIFVAQKK